MRFGYALALGTLIALPTVAANIPPADHDRILKECTANARVQQKAAEHTPEQYCACAIDNMAKNLSDADFQRLEAAVQKSEDSNTKLDDWSRQTVHEKVIADCAH